MKPVSPKEVKRRNLPPGTDAVVNYPQKKQLIARVPKKTKEKMVDVKDYRKKK